MKDKKDKEALVKYIQEHTQERLWQAILNWSGFPYILWADSPDGKGETKDTFHITYD